MQSARANRAQPVSDDEGGASLHQPVESQTDEMLRFGIHTGSRIIQNQNTRIHQHGAGNGDTLFLPARSGLPPFTHVCPITGRHF